MLRRAAADVARPHGWRDSVVPQRWGGFTADDHAVWDLLFARQVELLGRARRQSVPRGDRPVAPVPPGRSRFDELNALLGAHRLAPVACRAGPRRHLLRHAQRAHIPGGQFHPQREQLDYLEEPDCFHDCSATFRCSPDQDFAGSSSISDGSAERRCAAGQRHRCGAIYWHSVEFGLAREERRSRSSAPGSPRASAKHISRGERHRRAPALLRRASPSAPPIATMSSPLYLLSPIGRSDGRRNPSQRGHRLLHPNVRNRGNGHI